MIARAAFLAALACAGSAPDADAQTPRYEGVVLEVSAVEDGAFGLEAAPPRARLALEAAPSRPDDRWLARDKALHAGGSFLLTLSGQYLLTDKAALGDGDALPVAAGAALALGLLKEVADSQRERDPHFCWRDLAADALGVALGAAVIAL